MNGFYKRLNKTLFNPTVLGHVCVIQIALLVFAFPITSAIPVILGVNSTPINIGLKLLYLFIAVYLFIGGILRAESRYISYTGIWIIAFWILYSIRLIYDREYIGIKFGASSLKFYSIAFGSCLFTALAIILNTRYVKLQVAKRIFYVTILLACISIILTILKVYGSLNLAVIASRAAFYIEVEGEEIAVLNPITISFSGELLAIFSLASILLFKNTRIANFFYTISFFLGLFVLILGASRGPLFVAVILLTFLFLIYFWYVRKTQMFFLKLFTTPLVLLLLFIQFVLPNVAWKDIEIVNRLLLFAEGQSTGDKEVRNYLWESAWQQFLEHPILGDQFLERTYSHYPHNIYLESLMATGIIGGTIFLSLIVYLLVLVLRHVLNRQKVVIFSLLLLSTLLANLTSGSLFGNISLWVLIAFIGSIPKKEVLSFNER